MAAELKKEVQVAEKEVPVKKAEGVHALTPFEEIDRVVERMFEGFFPRGWMRPMMRWEWPAWPSFEEVRIPHVDVIERDAEVVVRAEVPGIDKKDLDVSVANNTVTIKGTTKKESKEEKGDYHRREISASSFSRTVVLPTAIDGANAKASFRDGVLELTLPKVEKRHPVKVD